MRRERSEGTAGRRDVVLVYVYIYLLFMIILSQTTENFKRS